MLYKVGHTMWKWVIDTFILRLTVGQSIRGNKKRSFKSACHHLKRKSYFFLLNFWTYTMPAQKKQFLEIEVKRESNSVSFTIKGAEEIEEYFADLAGEAEFRSEKWTNADGTGAKFYKLDTTSELEEFLASHYAYNDVGSYLMQNNKVNIAFLRVKGLSQGVTIKCAAGQINNNVDIELFVRTFCEVSKNFYKKFIARQSIKATVTYEL